MRLQALLLSAALAASLLACSTPQPHQNPPPDRPLSLAGTQWQVATLGGEAVPGKPLTPVFTDDNRSNGYAGCNRFFAQYETQGNQLRIDNIGSTRMSCDQARNTIEQRFLRGLETVRSVRGTQQSIQLIDEKGSVVVELQSVAAGV